MYNILQFGDEHPLEIEALWAALVTTWPSNLKVIIRYLLVLVNIAATDLLPYVSTPDVSDVIKVAHARMLICCMLKVLRNKQNAYTHADHCQVGSIHEDGICPLPDC